MVLLSTLNKLHRAHTDFSTKNLFFVETEQKFDKPQEFHDVSEVLEFRCSSCQQPPSSSHPSITSVQNKSFGNYNN